MEFYIGRLKVMLSKCSFPANFQSWDGAFPVGNDSDYDN